MRTIKRSLKALGSVWRRACSSLRRAGPGHVFIRTFQELGHLGKQYLTRIPVDAVDRQARARVLVIDALMPVAERDSGSLRMLHMLDIWVELGCQVTFMPAGQRSTAAERESLIQRGVRLLCRPHTPSLGAWLKRHGPTLDLVLLCRHYVAAAHIDLLRSMAPQARIVFDTVDLHYLREQREAELFADHRLARQASVSRRSELALISRADVTLVVSHVEQMLLKQDVPDADIQLLSNIHSLHPVHHSWRQRHGLIFVGGFAHPPNRDAAYWLVEALFPVIRKHLPDVELHLVGDVPDADRERLSRPGIIVHGRVPDIEPFMQDCRIALAPLRYGAGVKGKVNMAMSYGLPVVLTSLAAEGMFITHDVQALVADEPVDFAAQVARLYNDENIWQRLSDAGQDNVQRHFSHEAARATLRSLLPSLPT